jgi:Fe2+ or Zn2+ uptake regulation protein
MPTVLILRGLKVVIYFNDHSPAHVHVFAHGCEVVLDLHCPDGPPEMRENYGFSFKEVRKIIDALTTHVATLCAKWKGIYGHY